MWTPTDTLNFLSPHLATKAQVENSRKSIPITGCGVYLKKKKKLPPIFIHHLAQISTYKKIWHSTSPAPSAVSEK